MERLAILAASALLMSTTALADCGGYNCTIVEPVVTTTLRADCAGANCARREPAPLQIRLDGRLRRFQLRH